MALIDKYNTPLTSRQVAHLLRRITFGGSIGSIKKFTGKTATEIADAFLRTPSAPTPPTDSDNLNFYSLPWGSPKTDNAAQTLIDKRRREDIKYWWIAQMTIQEENIIEKMTLFWQNHFVSTTSAVLDSRYIYSQYQLLRKHSLGNFRTFVIEITKDPAMLIYLNGNQNIVGKPNENYGRELQELFTIGRGNYTEDDVKNAARVLTGWHQTGLKSTTSSKIGYEFRPDEHDTSDKTFSSFYQNKIIKGRSGKNAGDLELVELVDMILKQEKTALFIVRKIYRWFVQADISEQIENEVIEPLATTFRKDYEIKPVLLQLFTSQHFYDNQLIGSQIKSPLDFIIGAHRHFNLTIPDPLVDRTLYDRYTEYLGDKAKALQMEVFNQDTVFGWGPYYDTEFYKLWINSTTLATRGSFTDDLVVGLKNLNININVVSNARNVSNASDPVVLVIELTEHLMAVDLTPAQIDFIIDEVLIPGLPRYEWAAEWNMYIANPNNNGIKLGIKAKLDNLYLYLLRLAEFQMG